MDEVLPEQEEANPQHLTPLAASGIRKNEQREEDLKLLKQQRDSTLKASGLKLIRHGYGNNWFN